MSDSNEPLDLMSDYVEVQRIDRTGTIWFAAIIVAVSLALGALIMSGWRPSELVEPAGIAWWIGTVMVSIGIAAVGYAGCPIYWGSVHTAHLQKSIAIRGGLVFFLFGAFIAVVAILAG